MINIFSRINKQLASWIAIWQFLRGLDRNVQLGDPESLFVEPPNLCKLPSNASLSATSPQGHEPRL